MKKCLLVLFFGLFMAGHSHAQLSGTKNIPGDYSTLAEAIADLNSAGAGVEGVTFILADGYTESFSTPTAGLINPPSSNSSNPVVIMRSGGGLAPMITAATGTGPYDYIFCLSGISNITFDGITIRENPVNSTSEQQMEWGFAILKASATQGSHNVVVKNCTISLEKTNPGSTGIYMDNINLTAPATQLTVTAFSGTNSGNHFFNNTLSNVNRGIYISGFADPASPYAFYDQNNDIGSQGGNQITNFGTGSQSVYGIYTAYQNGLTIANSTINGGEGSTGNVYGIYGGTANNANATFYSNTVTVTSAGTTAGLYGIYNAGIGNGGLTNTLNFFNNTLENCTYPTATAATFYGIYNVATAGTINVYSNTAQNNSTSGTTQQYLIYTNSTAANSVNVYNNIVSGNQVTGSGSQTDRSYIFGIQTIGWGNISIHDNQVFNNSLPAQNVHGAGIYGIHGGFSAQNLTIYNNTIHDLAVTGAMSANTSSVIYGMYIAPNSFTNMGANSIHHNTIYNLTMTLSSTYGGYMYGIYSQYMNNIYSNNISNIVFANTSTGYGYGAGLYYSSTALGYIHENNINYCSMKGTSAYYYGIQVAAGDNVSIYNNDIADLNVPNSTANIALSGIYLGSPVQARILNNSIYLNATSTSTGTFGTTGVYSPTGVVLDMRNNLIINTSSAPASATFRTIAFQRSSSTFSTYSTTSNYNDFYAGTPSANNLIFYDGINSIQTLTAYKSFAVQRDANSISELPPFAEITTRPYDLHIKSSIPNQCESGGSVISGILNITTDFDGVPRYPNPGYPAKPGYPPTAPDMGAFEFGGIPLDLTPPGILFTPLSRTSSTSARSLDVTITDVSGVAVSGIALPVLYWKIMASGSWNQATATWTSGNTYSFSFGGGVSFNDSVYYYIVAQDMNPAGLNIGATPSNVSGYSANPPACSVPPPNASCYSYKITGTLCGTINVGTGQTYPTITAAINDLNSCEVTCPVVFRLTDATYPSETFPLTINNPLGVSDVNTITFRPAEGVTTTISGNGTAVFKFVQASHIIIDGSNSGGIDRNLTISNTATSGTTAVIWFGSNGTGMGSSGNVLRNCNINSSYVTSTSYAIFAGSAGAIGTLGDDNDNIIIRNNNISRAYRGIWIQASTNGPDDNLLIADNILGADITSVSLTNYGIYLAGVNAPQIVGNTIYNMVNSIISTICAIELNNNVSNAMISNNLIHDLKSTSSMGPAVYGINIGTAANVVNATLINNVIYNITSTQYAVASTQYNPFGVRIVSGSGHKLYHNTISMAGTQSPPGSSGSLSAAIVFPYPIVSGLDIRNNIFANSIVGLAGSSSYCIYAVAGATFGTIDHNDYYPSGTYGKFGFLGVAVNSLAEWQAATGQDAHSLNTNPLFISATDLHAQGPLLNNGGIMIPMVPADFAWVTRTNPPDVGAYEFTLAINSINTLEAIDPGISQVTLSGDINTNGEMVNVSFEFGTELSYGSSATAVPAQIRSFATTGFTADLSGLNPGTLYHFRAKGNSVTSGETIFGSDMTFRTHSVPVDTTLVNTIVGSGEVHCYNALQTLTVAGNNTTFVVQNGGSATMIAGMKIRYLPGTQVRAGGIMHGYITTNNEFCGYVPSPMVARQSQTGLPEKTEQESFISVYPNPTTGIFTAEISGKTVTEHAVLEIYRITGEKVFVSEMNGVTKQILSLSGQPTGIYILRFLAPGNSPTVRIIKL